MKRLMKRRQRGQGMTEYIIIVAVVAVLSIGIVVKFGDTIRNLFTVTGERMTGETTTTLDNQMTGDYQKGLTDLNEDPTE